MAQIWEYIKIALMNIKSNKGRSVLTMLGIIIGIAFRDYGYCDWKRCPRTGQ